MPAKFLLISGRALSVLTGFTLTSLTWGPHPLPIGHSFCQGCSAGVPVGPWPDIAMDMSGRGPTPWSGLLTTALLCHVLPGQPLHCAWPWLPSPGLILSHAHTLLAWPGLASAHPCPCPRGHAQGLGLGLGPLSPADPAPIWRWVRPAWEASAPQLWGPWEQRHLWHPASYLEPEAGTWLHKALPYKPGLAPGSDPSTALTQLNPSFWVNPSQGNFGVLQRPSHTAALPRHGHHWSRPCTAGWWPSSTWSGIIMDRLAVTGLCPTLVPCHWARRCPQSCLLTMSSSGSLLSWPWLLPPDMPCQPCCELLAPRALPAPLTVLLVPPRGWATAC